MAADQHSILHLVTQASPLVQGVMLLLVLTSIVSWFFILHHGATLRDALRQLNGFEAHFRDEPELGKLLHSRPLADYGVSAIVSAGYREFSALHQHPGIAPEVTLEATQRALRMAIAQEEERLNRTLPFLASVGSTSPYIGLFGTVWGIMNSFVGLSDAQQATLAAVAPGIAEALVATAIGLFAAIPAVLAYNRLSARVETLLNRYFTLADALTAQLCRTLYVRPL